MSLSDVSIRNPVFSWMLMFALILFGGIAFERMGVSQLPDVDFPVVNVSLTLDGAAPEIMELDIVDPVEDAIMSVQGIESLSSSSRMGSANITVEFSLDKDIDTAVQEIQNAIARVSRTLPEGMDPPTVRKSSPDDQPILWLAVSSDSMTAPELMTFVNDQVKNRFSSIDGVGEVFLGGYVNPSLRIWLKRETLSKYAMTASDVITAIRSEHAEVPSGRLQDPRKETNIRTLGEARSVEEFEGIAINRRGGGPNYVPVSLKDVARVEDGLEDIRRISRSGGKPSVGIGIRKQRGANAVGVAKQVRARMEEIRSFLPKGTDIGVRFDTTGFIEEAVHELNFTLVLSGLLTALVCWLFLGSWSATLNVIMAIPTSVVGSFIVLQAMGFTLNTFTLLGLSLAIGIVVDDAIMVLENIVRHIEMGKTRMAGARDGAREITFAALAATIAIIAIFLPVAFMQGIIGRYFYQFGVTISVAVAISLLEALTLTPMRSSRYLTIEQRTTWLGKGVESMFQKSEVWYRSVVKKLLNHRWSVVFAAIVIFAASYSFIRVLKKEFVPPQDQSRLMLRAQLPEGSSLELTDAKVKEVEDYLSQRSEVDQYFTSVGGFSGEVNSGTVFVTLKSLDDRPKNEKGKRPSQAEIAQRFRRDLKSIQGARILVQDPSVGGLGGGRGYPVEFTVRGPEWDQLVNASKIMMDGMASTGIMSDIDSSYRAGMPEIQVIPDREKARNRGVSIAEIGEVIGSMMGGVVAGKFSKGGHRYDARVQVTPDERKGPSDISGIQVRNNRGELIPLKDVVTLKEHESLTSISREDRERAIKIFANVVPGSSQSDALAAVESIAHEKLPQGYRIAISGNAKTFNESFQSLIFALILGLIVSYMVLASQFNSFIHPITVLVALPFSVSGAFVALWAGGQTLNIYSMIGLILLMGIVKKNSILMVDFTNQVRDGGKGVRESLIEACPTRLRPILMTSIATVAGAIPAALAIGPGAESRIPMALALIGGVVVSTALTLFVVPCVYSLFSSLERPEKEDAVGAPLHHH